MRPSREPRRLQEAGGEEELDTEVSMEGRVKGKALSKAHAPGEVDSWETL